VFDLSPLFSRRVNVKIGRVVRPPFVFIDEDVDLTGLDD
jgi:hypothetical protein